MSAVSNKENRRLVIQDVLSHLRYLKRLGQGEYMFGVSSVVCDLTDDAQKHLSKIQKQCQVCAIGSIVLSFVRLFDKVTVGDLCKEDLDCIPTRSAYIKMLAPTFSESQLLLVETAFERAVVCEPSDTSEPTLKQWKAMKFGRKFPDDNKKRLKAILENMLENDTIFTP